MKENIYLDTSVISAYFDLKKPLRQHITQKWFENDLADFSPFISTLVLDEIEQTKDVQLKQNMFRLIETYSLHALKVNPEIFELAQLYRQEILSREINDTIHIATASYYNLEAIVSWNFKHIVNLQTINKIHKINFENDYKIIEIITIENVGGEKYGSL